MTPQHGTAQLTALLSAAGGAAQNIVLLKCKQIRLKDLPFLGLVALQALIMRQVLVRECCHGVCVVRAWQHGLCWHQPSALDVQAGSCDMLV